MIDLKLPWKFFHLDRHPSQIVGSDNRLVAEVYSREMAEYIVEVFNDAYLKSKESSYD
jgi:hypothetical protein